jgi:integrase
LYQFARLDIRITNILIDTGYRRGEAMGLKWESIDLENKIITIERALLYTPETGIFEGPPKNGESRTIRIAPETAGMLRLWKTEQDRLRQQAGKLWTETGYVFTKENGVPLAPDSITQWLDGFSKKH